MNKNLIVQMLAKVISGLVIIALLLFLPAGTFRYWNAWLFLAEFFIPMTCIGLFLLLKDPDFLKKRLNTNEKEKEQKAVVAFSALLFVCGFVVSAFDFRFRWLPVPAWVSVAAAVLFLAAYGIYIEVMKENAYLSRTVEIQENQKVVDTGLYGIVRHPMYFATVLLFLSMPLVLGSLCGFIVFLLYPFVLVKRIHSEEKVLEKGLPGYIEYEQKVRWHLIPFIW